MAAKEIKENNQDLFDCLNAVYKAHIEKQDKTIQKQKSKLIELKNKLKSKTKTNA